MRNEKECVCSAPNCCDTEQRSASQPEMPGSVASGHTVHLNMQNNSHNGLTAGRLISE